MTGDYGYDEPVWLILLTAVDLVQGAVALVGFRVMRTPVVGYAASACALIFLLGAASDPAREVRGLDPDRLKARPPVPPTAPADWRSGSPASRRSGRPRP